MIMNLFITGSNGFVGKQLSDIVVKKKYTCSLSARSHNGNLTGGVNPRYVQKTIAPDTHWENELKHIDCVIHTAALVHQMSGAPESHYRDINTYGTLNLAQQAADAGVKRFIFISSIKVNGESTELGLPFKPDDNFMPTDPYGLSKYEAEVGLRKIANETGLEVVIIRPPLVYGPGVKANFAVMMKWINKGIPLPLGGIKDNRRSLVSLDNLVDLIIACIEHPKAANETFLVSDGNDLSTSQLLFEMATALNVSSRLLPIPSKWFIVIAKLLGKPAISQRLCDSLQVDISKTREVLSWKPCYTQEESMKRTAVYFLEGLTIKTDEK